MKQVQSLAQKTVMFGAVTGFLLLSSGIAWADKAPVPPPWKAELAKSKVGDVLALRKKVPAWIAGGADPVAVLEAYKERLEDIADTLGETCVGSEDRAELKQCQSPVRKLTEFHRRTWNQCTERDGICIEIRWRKAVRNLTPRLDPLVMKVMALQDPLELEFDKHCVPTRIRRKLAATNRKRLRAGLALKRKASKSRALSKRLGQQLRTLETA